MTYNYNDPKIWSTHYWFVLHTIGLNYPLNPNNVCKKKYYNFIQTIPLLIPNENISNMFTNLNLTDMETCYKVFRNEILQKIEIKEDRFGVEPELTAKIAKLGCRIYEVGISYSGRTYSEGKKINWKDGVRAIWCILKYNLFSLGSLSQKK